MNIRVLPLICAGALSVIASGALLTFGAAAQTVIVAMDGGGPPAPVRPAPQSLPAANPDPAVRSARSIECAQKADAQGLQGKARKHFLYECKRGE